MSNFLQLQRLSFDMFFRPVVMPQQQAALKPTTFQKCEDCWGMFSAPLICSKCYGAQPVVFTIDVRSVPTKPEIQFDRWIEANSGQVIVLVEQLALTKDNGVPWGLAKNGWASASSQTSMSRLTLTELVKRTTVLDKSHTKAENEFIVTDKIDGWICLSSSRNLIWVSNWDLEYMFKPVQ